jgi:hypothetical protein
MLDPTLSLRNIRTKLLINSKLSMGKLGGGEYFFATTIRNHNMNTCWNSLRFLQKYVAAEGADMCDICWMCLVSIAFLPKMKQIVLFCIPSACCSSLTESLS